MIHAVAPSEVRIAESLIDRVHVQTLHMQRRELLDLMKHDPQRMVEVLVALATIAAKHVPPDPAANLSRDEWFRAAHAAYARGERNAWVIEGQRGYERERKRRKRGA